tara:strand:- start:4012 stop:4455 length:444 start_codon:yes stop_codon:yes gene_type:complete
MIYTYDYYHGSAINRLLDTGKSIKLMNFPSDTNSSYTLNDKIGLFVKYSEKRISPWRFNFNKSHQQELNHMKDLHKKVYVIFVCSDDGFTCLSWSELKKLLDENIEDGEWIYIKRMRREKYTVTGSDGKLKYKIGKNDYPNKIIKNL